MVRSHWTWTISAFTIRSGRLTTPNSSGFLATPVRHVVLHRTEWVSQLLWSTARKLCGAVHAEPTLRGRRRQHSESHGRTAPEYGEQLVQGDWAEAALPGRRRRLETRGKFPAVERNSV